MHRTIRCSTIALALMTSHPAIAVAQTPQVLSTVGLTIGEPLTDPVGARTWIGREAEIEAFLATVDVLGLKDLPIGVTSPKSASLAPGGPVGQFVWKPLTPGIQNGFYESYKAEVAAYKLDQLLGLDMVPVTVERQIRGKRGAAVMWVSPAQSFRDLGGAPRPPTSHLDRWSMQLVRAKMFDNLIYNQDPNEGNWLVDPAWNLVRIDHSRAFSPNVQMAHPGMTHVDRQLWARMQQLDEPRLAATLGTWLSTREIQAILDRRDRMAETIDALVATHGAEAVLLHYGRQPGATARPAPDRTGTPISGDLVTQLLAAAHEPPVILPWSEVAWTGTLVNLDQYLCLEAEVREPDAYAGCALGLLAGEELLCLSASARDLTPYGHLPMLIGRDVEILGVLADRPRDIPVVEVTRARIR
jgi:hypothetical protein